MALGAGLDPVRTQRSGDFKFPSLRQKTRQPAQTQVKCSPLLSQVASRRAYSKLRAFAQCQRNTPLGGVNRRCDYESYRQDTLGVGDGVGDRGRF